MLCLKKKTQQLPPRKSLSYKRPPSTNSGPGLTLLTGTGGKSVVPTLLWSQQAPPLNKISLKITRKTVWRCMWAHSRFSGAESALGSESGMMITGCIQQRDGLKEAEGLFHQIIIRAVPWVPPGWLEWEKGATVWKIKSLSLELSTQTVWLIPTVCLLFIYEWHGNMDSWSGDSNLAIEASFFYLLNFTTLKCVIKIILKFCVLFVTVNTKRSRRFSY